MFKRSRITATTDQSQKLYLQAPLCSTTLYFIRDEQICTIKAQIIEHIQLKKGYSLNPPSRILLQSSLEY